LPLLIIHQTMENISKKCYTPSNGHAVILLRPESEQHARNGGSQP
jgi:hypothetical protein